jgi:hypothetical protein
MTDEEQSNEASAPAWQPLGRYEQIVRCSRGHLYRTIWWRWGSLKAVRLGVARYQRCPVCRRWRMTRRVRREDLTPAELAEAAVNHDSGIW